MNQSCLQQLPATTPLLKVMCGLIIHVHVATLDGASTLVFYFVYHYNAVSFHFGAM